MVFLYLIKNAVRSVILFFVHWYWGGFWFVYGKALGLIRGLERQLAIRINIHFLFAPLYQEYNIYGYVLGFLFRSIRIIGGSLAYFLIMIGALAVYLLWALIPIIIIYKIATQKR